MSFIHAIARFASLVQKVEAGTTPRSENDLSSNLTTVLKSLGLSTVIDTGVASGPRKRPDILGYVSEEDSDLVLPAELVFESKKPDEVRAYSDLSEAMVSDWIWSDKTLPYIQANIARIQYFALTTFTSFAVLPITADLRQEFILVARGKDDHLLREHVRCRTLLFQLAAALPASDPRSGQSWRAWIETHFAPSALQPVPISEIHNAFAIRTRHELEAFATRLAEFAAGSTEERLANAGLFHSIT